MRGGWGLGGGSRGGNYCLEGVDESEERNEEEVMETQHEREEMRKERHWKE